jgi:hypothetical protein
MKKSYFLFLILGLLMISCSSDGLETDFPERNLVTDVPKDGPVANEDYLLKKWSWRKYGETENQGEVEYEYDDNERLILETSHYYYENTIPELDLEGGIVKYTYEEDVTIAKYYSLENELKSTTHYIKEPDNIIRSKMYYPDGTSRLLGIAELNDNSCGMTKYEWFDGDSERRGYDEYEYVDANCSFIATSHNNEGEMEYKDYVTMDSKNGWHTSISRHHHFGNTSSHNVLEYESKDATGTVISSSKSEYDYNAQDYPVSKIHTNSDGNKMEYFYEYY